ncbi:hypothetical protein DL89DRAFT_264377 [Linderina pennispora]|uniref:Amino acid transporter transmembrane domain-containing protein n=1 Tax=Linderina pennispora TaxID=61395 RepID=A0A1Y1WN36_9FUNG|nr:uncharacterized protein DL89DRAFT_264377 [Linderina pennispora]ORX74524.1 hypothetical protein DL89DRAFT_264377 [Linderina pennispora]
MDAPGTNSINGAAFNVLNSIIGSGIICLPIALKNAGLVAGILLLILVGMISQFTTYTLVFTGKRTNAMSYSEVARQALGTTGYRILNASLIFSMLGALTTYLIIVGDILTALREAYLPALAWATRSATIIGVSVSCISPFLFFRNSGPLAKISCRTDYPLVLGSKVFPALGMLSFSFCSSHAAFQNFLGLEVRSLQNWRKCTMIATWAALVICCSFAVIGLMSFGSGVQANIFQNFPQNDPYVNVARLLFCLTLVLTFPLTFYPARDTLTHMLHIDQPQLARLSTREMVCSLTLFGLVIAAATQCTDLGMAYELVGAATATVIGFVFPSLIFLWSGSDLTVAKVLVSRPVASLLPLIERTKDTDEDNIAQGRQSVTLWSVGWFVFYFGITVFFVGTYSIIHR